MKLHQIRNETRTLGKAVYPHFERLELNLALPAAKIIQPTRGLSPPKQIDASRRVRSDL